MNKELEDQVLAILDMTHEGSAQQAAALASVNEAARSRVARLVPYMLSDEQLDELYTHGTANVERWVAEHIPRYQDLVRSITLDIADEASDINRMHDVTGH